MFKEDNYGIEIADLGLWQTENIWNIKTKRRDQNNILGHAVYTEWWKQQSIN